MPPKTKKAKIVDEEPIVCSISMMTWEEIPENKRFRLTRKKDSVIYHADPLGSWVFELGHGTYPHSRATIEKSALERLLKLYKSGRTPEDIRRVVKFPLRHFRPLPATAPATVPAPAPVPAPATALQHSASFADLERRSTVQFNQTLADMLRYFQWTFIMREMQAPVNVNTPLLDANMGTVESDTIDISDMHGIAVSDGVVALFCKLVHGQFGYGLISISSNFEFSITVFDRPSKDEQKTMAQQHFMDTEHATLKVLSDMVSVEMGEYLNRWTG